MAPEDWSDLCGFLSGAALLVTAWRNDGLFGFVDRLRASVDQARQDIGKATARPVNDAPAAPAVADDRLEEQPDKLAGPIVEALQSELTKWTWVDRWALRVGAFLLCVSYGLKLFS